MVREPGPDAELLRGLVQRGVAAFTSMSIQKAVAGSLAWLDDPTLAETVSAAARAPLHKQLTNTKPNVRSKSAKSYAVLERGLRTYLEAGVKVVMSADTGLFTQFVGFAEHRELEAMVDAGMPALDAIRAATQVPARLLGLADRGTLEVGRRADFIVLTANPLSAIANTRKIADVYIAGVAIDRPRLRASFLA
jgi:imidazolonepropionase-like amidohydrolase